MSEEGRCSICGRKAKIVFICSRCDVEEESCRCEPEEDLKDEL